MSPLSYFHPAAEDSGYLTTDPILPAAELASCQHPACGGIVLFCGDVRDFNNQQSVSHIEYEVYEPLAQKMIRAILCETIEKYALGTAKAVHRTGLVAVGETAVIVITAHRHRLEAYRANEEIIYRIKHEVPIWKREVYASGDFIWGTNDTPRS